MSTTNTKFISDNAVTGAKIRLGNQENFRGRNAANTADINILQVNGADKPEFQTQPVAAPALPIPSSPKDYATIEYIQNFVNGKADAKDAVNLLADANVALTGSTPLTVDGVTVTNGMRLGLIGQTAGAENGIYDAEITGGTYTLTRSFDANTSAEVTSGMNFKVIQGSTYALWEAILQTPDPITLDTTVLTFVKTPSVEAVNAGDGIKKTGNKFEVDYAALGGLRSTNPGNDAGQLAVKTDSNALLKDKSTGVNSTGDVVALKAAKAVFTLASQDITNQYLDLPDVAADSSIQFEVAGAPTQVETIDYTVNYTGGTGSKTRVTFAGGLASAGVSALAVGDVVIISYLKLVL